MKLRLYLTFVLVGIIILLCGVLAPPSIAIPLFLAVTWLMPAYWIAGVIYSREAKRAYFIGGLAGGAIPFLGLVLVSLTMLFEGWNSWGYRGWDRSGIGNNQLMNLTAALYIFAPIMMAFFGGWVATAVFYSVQPATPASKPASPFRELIPVAIAKSLPEMPRKPEA